MSAPPNSVEGLEQKGSSQIYSSEKGSVGEGQTVSANAEYDRYLDLHREFEGAKRKRLVRKRMSTIPVLRIKTRIANLPLLKLMGVFYPC